MQTIYCCRWAPSLGELDNTHENVWDTVNYEYRKHKDMPTVFFGLYDLRDYIALWRHKGKKYVLWAGSDIRNLHNQFMFNDGKLKRISQLFGGIPRFFRNYLHDHVEHWVENEREQELLYRSIGVAANVGYSFLGKIDDYVPKFKASKFPHVYVSSGKDRQKEYGFPIIDRIAQKVPFVTFHLYGANWKRKHQNIKIHGKVPRNAFNREIEGMQAGVRLNEFEGFSEIVAKAVLQGQAAITRIPYEHMYSFETDYILRIQS